MDYQVFEPQPDLASVVKCYWTLEVPAEESGQRQRILPDGCIEMIFILGDDIKRIISENEYALQPRSFILGQITEPFLVEPTGRVYSFAVRFYPYSFAGLVATSINQLANKETPIVQVYDAAQAAALEQRILQAADTAARIAIVEDFLLNRLTNETVIDSIVKSTVDALLSTGGSTQIHAILKEDLSKRRQLERKFVKQVGMSPKQLGRVIRLQMALKMLLNQQAESLTSIAYETEYYDQAHFIKDFKEFTGTTPKDFMGDDELMLSALLYKKG